MHELKCFSGFESLFDTRGTLLHYEYKNYYYIFYSYNSMCFEIDLKKETEEAINFENNYMVYSNLKA